MPCLFACCECSSAAALCQQVAANAGVINWMSIPLYKGKEHCLTVLSRFSEGHRRLLAFRALEGYIQQEGQYATIIGYDNEYFYWANINSNSPKDQLDAQAILKRFA